MSVEINVTDQIIEVTPTDAQINVNITENPVVVDATDQIIEIADTGLQGPQGPAGPGVPTGGTTGQILVKSSNTNFDTGWSSTNATLGEYGLSAGYLKVDTTPTNTPADQGTMYWDDNAETVALIMNGTIQKIGEDLFFHVKNSSGSSIAKGTCVRFAGTDGNSGKLLIAPFLANGTYSSQYFMGVAAETIANGADGKVYHFGKIRGVNTNAYQNGDILYASTTVAGGFQTTVPTAPNNIIIVAAVISAANNGTLMVRSTLGSNINNDEGVKITNPTNGQVLKYNSTSGLWENAVGGGTGTVTSVNASGGTGISVSGGPITTSGTLTITNTAPDQIVSLSGSGTTSISGTYPNFTITSNDQYDGTVTSVDASGGTGISVSGGPITSSGSFTITNTAPDQVVSLTGTGTTSISGTYPNFTINSDDQYDGTVTSVDLTAGTGISVSGGPITSSGSITVTNTAPDQVVSITGSGTTSVSGTYPNFTISSADQYVGTVTSVDASVPTGFSISGNPITSSGTLAIGFASGYSLPTNAKQTEWDSAYTNRITTLTTTGSSGSATLISNTLNIPAYTLSGLGGVPSTRTLTVNGTGYDLSADRSWSVGTITSLTGEATASGSGAVSVTLDNASVIGKVLTGLNLTGGGSIVSTDSILQAFGKVQNQISALVGSVQYEGVWNASTNSPTISSGVGSKGDYYVVNVAGSTTIDGISDWKIGDWIIFNGTTWDKVDNTDAVSSVNGFTGAVSLSTSNIGEGTNLYFTNIRAQNAITLTTSGTSGSATYSGGTLNIPTYSLSGLGGVPTTRTLTINGTAYDLSADRSWSVGTVTSVAALTIGTTGADISSSVANGTTTPVITLNIPTASATNRGALSSADWSTFNSKEPAIAAGTTSQYWRGDKSWQTLNTAAVTESTNLYYTDARARAALSFVAGSGAYNSTTGVITIPTNTNQLTNGANYITLASLSASAPLSYNSGTGAFTISQASTSTNGFLSSTDWNTFNNKFNLPSLTSGSVLFSNGTTIAQDNANFFWDDTNNRLGIGTATPSKKLEIAGSIYINTGTLYMPNSLTNRTAQIEFGNLTSGDILGIPNSTSTFYLTYGTDNIYFRNDSGGNILSMTSGGNVLVGTITDNGAKLQVEGGSIRFNWSNPAASNYIWINRNSNNDGGILLTKDNTLDWQISNVSSTGNLVFYSYGSSTNALTLTRATGAATFSSSVMVNGSTVSNEGLSVQYNQAKTFTTQVAVSRWHSNEASGSQFKLNLFAIGNATGSSRVFKFQTSNEGVANDGIIALQSDGGNVGIGTTSPKSYASLTTNGMVAALGSVGVSIGESFRINNYYNSGTITDRTISTGYAASVGLDNANGAMTFNVSSTSVAADNNITVTERMRITSGGNVGIGTNDPKNKLDVVRGSTAGAMGRGTYESGSFTFDGDNKLGVYTTASTIAGSAAALALGMTNTTVSSIYPGFEMQYIPNATLATNRVRINFLGRNSTGSVASSVEDIFAAYQDGLVIMNATGVGSYSPTPRVLIATSTDDGVNKLQVNGNIKASQFRLSGLNTAPASASATGTTGEIRIDAFYIYVCISTNSWKRVAISSW